MLKLSQVLLYIFCYIILVQFFLNSLSSLLNILYPVCLYSTFQVFRIFSAFPSLFCLPCMLLLIYLFFLIPACLPVCFLFFFGISSCLSFTYFRGSMFFLQRTSAFLFFNKTSTILHDLNWVLKKERDVKLLYFIFFIKKKQK